MRITPTIAHTLARQCRLLAVLLIAAAGACRSREDAPGDSGGPATSDGGAAAGIGSAKSNAQFEAQRPRTDTLPDGRPANGTADTPNERGVSRP